MVHRYEIKLLLRREIRHFYRSLGAKLFYPLQSPLSEGRRVRGHYLQPRIIRGDDIFLNANSVAAKFWSHLKKLDLPLFVSIIISSAAG